MDYPFISLGPTLHLLALFLVFALALGAIGAACAAAMLPGWIAASRSHPQASAVKVCGWLGLPTGILWVVALVWAFWREQAGRSPSAVDVSQLRALDDRLDELEALVAGLERQQQAASR